MKNEAGVTIGGGRWEKSERRGGVNKLRRGCRYQGDEQCRHIV